MTDSYCDPDCNAPAIQIMVLHAGVNDVKKYVASSKHKESSKTLSGHENLSFFFQTILMIKLQEQNYCLPI